VKLALFNDFTPGVVAGDRIADVSKVVGDGIMALRFYERIPAIIHDFVRLRAPFDEAGGRADTALAGVRLRAPLPRPSKIVCAIGNFFEGTKTPRRPLDMFLKAPSSILDPEGTVELPPHKANVFHHEAELAVVIGRRAKNVPQTQARDHVFGYCCFIDVSARGLGQGVGFRGKSFDTFGPLGPWIVTADEIPDPQKLQIRLWVDGRARHNYNTDDMEHPVDELVSWTSQVCTLEPGDLISCGTNHQEIGPVQDGERVEIEVERVGRMAVKVHDTLKRTWPKEIDKSMADFVRERRINPNIPLPKVLVFQE
jgi:2-keto-4-pentenoate hydratase/2-oxohepta-3-ene-1,7-dioic acid hydratase in catechol pathway